MFARQACDVVDLRDQSLCLMSLEVDTTSVALLCVVARKMLFLKAFIAHLVSLETPVVIY